MDMVRIMVNHDQHTTNGLTFMPALGYECYFYLFIYGYDAPKNFVFL